MPEPNKPGVPTTAAPSIDMGASFTGAFTELQKTLKESVDRLIERDRRQVPIGSYVNKGDPYHSNDKSKACHLTKMIFQNGNMLFDERITDDEARALNQISISGVYLEGLVTVRAGKENGVDVVHLDYDNKSRDQSDAVRSQCRNLRDMAEMIVAAQDARKRVVLA